MEERVEQTRVRIAYKVSAKGVFQPDVTAEAETVESAERLLNEGLEAAKRLAEKEGTL
jgi:hypothetical protein